MVGYVVADKPELKVKEYELYCSYYCGVCKSIGKRHGFFPRLVLSYDSAFLAMILSSLNSKEETILREHCIIHPVKKKNICVENPAVDYAADVMIILAYQKVIDDIKDDNKASAKAMKLMFQGTYRKLQAKYPRLCLIIEKELEVLSAMEKEKCSSIDMTSDAFARIMEAVFNSYSDGDCDDVQRKVLGNIGFHLGKWMYLIDAFDDIDENIEDKNYNPLIYRFAYDPVNESKEAFKERIIPRTEFLLFHYLGEMEKAYNLLDLGKNKGIASNIIYFGLNRKTEQVLGKGNDKDERSL
ncbi:MAG: hypothetical protein IKL72_03985 [Firmicutes bacterium]|nr:hypothetical protein [Bacillota bacterium]